MRTRTTVQRNLLKYAAGTAITCPKCGDILDCKRTVLIDITGDRPRTQVMCTTCWGMAPHVMRQHLIGGGVMDVLDGRILWGKGK